MPNKTDRSERALLAGRSRRRDVSDDRHRLLVTERDRAVLYDVFVHGAMRRDQIQARHFGSVPRCNSRLAALFHARYLERAFLPVSPHPQTASGTQIVYLLGTEGVPLVAAMLDWEPGQVRERLRHGTPTYLAHTLEIVAFRIALEADIARQHQLALTRFVPERLARHEYQVRKPGGEWRAEVFKPDAVFVLERSEREFGYALEIDLGHTSRKELGRKAEIHARYEQHGLFAKRYGPAEFTTLFVTTSDTRRDRMLTLFRDMPRCRVTTFAALRERSIPEAVWHVPGSATLSALGEDRPC